MIKVSLDEHNDVELVTWELEPRIGSRVEIKGLALVPELNGSSGRILQFFEDSLRYEVSIRVSGEHTSLALRPQKFRVMR